MPTGSLAPVSSAGVCSNIGTLNETPPRQSVKDVGLPDIRALAPARLCHQWRTTLHLQTNRGACGRILLLPLRALRMRKRKDSRTNYPKWTDTSDYIKQEVVQWTNRCARGSPQCGDVQGLPQEQSYPNERQAVNKNVSPARDQAGKQSQLRRMRRRQRSFQRNQREAQAGAGGCGEQDSTSNNDRLGTLKKIAQDRREADEPGGRRCN